MSAINAQQSAVHKVSTQSVKNGWMTKSFNNSVFVDYIRNAKAKLKKQAMCITRNGKDSCTPNYNIKQNKIKLTL